MSPNSRVLFLLSPLSLLPLSHSLLCSRRCPPPIFALFLPHSRVPTSFATDGKKEVREAEKGEFLYFPPFPLWPNISASNSNLSLSLPTNLPIAALFSFAPSTSSKNVIVALLFILISTFPHHMASSFPGMALPNNQNIHKKNSDHHFSFLLPSIQSSIRCGNRCWPNSGF